jgi:hypothetical protein
MCILVIGGKMIISSKDLPLEKAIGEENCFFGANGGNKSVKRTVNDALKGIMITLLQNVGVIH